VPSFFPKGLILLYSCHDKSKATEEALVSKEAEEDYHEILTRFAECLRLNRIDPPSVVITDREWALINALSKVFESTDRILCKWHTNRDVFACCLRVYPQVWSEEEQACVDVEAALKAFELYWKCIDSPTSEAFTESCHVLDEAFLRISAYLEKH